MTHLKHKAGCAYLVNPTLVTGTGRVLTHAVCTCGAVEAARSEMTLHEVKDNLGNTSIAEDWVDALARELATHWPAGPGPDDYITPEQRASIAALYAEAIRRWAPPPKDPPLLQCPDCKNTESCAGAMARYFNQGRCLHCGGLFKVVRA